MQSDVNWKDTNNGSRLAWSTETTRRSVNGPAAGNASAHDPGCAPPGQLREKLNAQPCG